MVDNIIDTSSPTNMISTQTEKKYAYTLLLDEKSLECPARIMASRLKRLDPDSDVVVFAVSHSGKELNITIPAATKVIHKKPASSRGKWQWRSTFSKFESARLHEYDAVMFLDLDNVVLQSPRYLFDTVSLASDVAAPAAYWLEQPYYMTGGPLIFRPSETLDKRIAKVMDANKVTTKYASEMDWFNEEFTDLQILDYTIPRNSTGENVQKMPYVLSDEIRSADDVFKLGKMMGFKHPSQLLEKATMVHFIERWKPYKSIIRRVIKTGAATKELLHVIALYDAEKMLVCSDEDA